jgi:hypothetical protein
MENKALREVPSWATNMFNLLIKEFPELLPPKMSEEEILKIIHKTAWQHPYDTAKNYNIHYEPFLQELAKALSGKIAKEETRFGDVCSKCGKEKIVCRCKPISNSGECEHEWVNYIGEFAKLYCKKCGIDAWEIKPSKKIEKLELSFDYLTEKILQYNAKSEYKQVSIVILRSIFEFERINRGRSEPQKNVLFIPDPFLLLMVGAGDEWI